MPYELNAVIGPFDLLRRRTAGIREAVVAPLRQSMGLVPVTEELLAELTGAATGHDGPSTLHDGAPTGADSTGPGCRPVRTMSPASEQILDGTLGRTLSDWAAHAPIAHVEADFHGGAGHQTAVVRGPGTAMWGPVHAAEFTGPREQWPINAALALLGVVEGGAEAIDHQDLFLAVGLGGEQDTDGWRAAGRTARWAASYDEWHHEQLAERERAARAAAEFERRRRLPDVPAALDGRAVMDLLGLPPGPLIGAATRHLQELHLERGPLAPEEAAALLRAWARHQERPTGDARTPPR
ncbi:hypothetical protein ACIPYS_08925 [Kitasatospora sp. NPDC089913]|uniref:hypothetical protein n=1 Tax=Kitasatospora sp. NPDC089913 TaxID=3364080 RepID=UPI00381A41A7